MGCIIIKPVPERDEYVIWSTEEEFPIACGTRAEMLEYLGGDLQAGECPTCRRFISVQDTPEARLRRTDLNGSSDLSHRFGWWDDGEFLYRQRGMLNREDLVRACQLVCDGRGDEVAALLDPLGAGEDVG